MCYVMVHMKNYIHLVTLVSIAVISIFARVYWMKYNYSSKPSYLAVIGVLSARENFEQRQVIRETWLQDLHLFPRILVKFVVGFEDCLIPPQYRVNVYQCIQEKQWDGIDFASNFPILTNHQLYSDFNSLYEFVAIDFEVTHSVVITSLALPCGCYFSDQNQEILVELRDLGNENAFVVSATFQSNSKGNENENCLKYERISPHLLPKGFQGSIVVHCPIPNNQHNCIGVKFNLSNIINPGVMFSPGVRYGYNNDDFPTRFLSQVPENSLFPALFQYYINDPEELKLHYQVQADEILAWGNRTRVIDQKLQGEINTFSDIVVVGNSGQRFIDTYRSLPEKLALFYSWSSENLSFDFVGKVDDDCFVDLKKIDGILRTRSYSTQTLSWLGNFRYDVPVDRWGKWADYHYTSPLYPAFACGTGNLISRPVAEWLSRNQELLFHYQGEDVSMGIWLSVVHPSLTQHNGFICDGKCEKNMVMTSQQNASSVKRMWRNKMKCQNPCDCE